jgi:hypothetical protein
MSHNSATVLRAAMLPQLAPEPDKERKLGQLPLAGIALDDRHTVVVQTTRFAARERRCRRGVVPGGGSQHCLVQFKKFAVAQAGQAQELGQHRHVGDPRILLVPGQAKQRRGRRGGGLGVVNPVGGARQRRRALEQRRVFLRCDAQILDRRFDPNRQAPLIGQEAGRRIDRVQRELGDAFAEMPQRVEPRAAQHAQITARDVQRLRIRQLAGGKNGEIDPQAIPDGRFHRLVCGIGHRRSGMLRHRGENRVRLETVWVGFAIPFLAQPVSRQFGVRGGIHRAGGVGRGRAHEFQAFVDDVDQRQPGLNIGAARQQRADRPTPRRDRRAQRDVAGCRRREWLGTGRRLRELQQLLQIRRGAAGRQAWWRDAVDQLSVRIYRLEPLAASPPRPASQHQRGLAVTVNVDPEPVPTVASVNSGITKPCVRA